VEKRHTRRPAIRFLDAGTVSLISGKAGTQQPQRGIEALNECQADKAVVSCGVTNADNLYTVTLNNAGIIVGVKIPGAPMDLTRFCRWTIEIVSHKSV
jgi:hypothetical protein